MRKAKGSKDKRGLVGDGKIDREKKKRFAYMQDEDNDELSPLVPFQFSSVPAELYITLWKGRERECVLSHRGSAEITFRRQNVEKALLRSANRQEQILPFSSASTNASMSFRWKTYGNSCRRKRKKSSQDDSKFKLPQTFPFFHHRRSEKKGQTFKLSCTKGGSSEKILEFGL